MDITVTREELVEIIEAAFDLGYKKGTKAQNITTIINSPNTSGIISNLCNDSASNTIKPYGMEFKYNGTER